MQIERLYQIFLNHPHIQTDTRKLAPGELFFCLKGPNFNANSFAQQAIDMGAAAVIVDEKTGVNNDKIIQVDDVLTSLQFLARHHRLQFQIPFIAITGSNGKTTTKELTHAVLSSTYNTYTTVGNLNNHIGIPLTILKIKKDAEMAIIEMGANHQKEIESYCEIALPTHGLINNCGKAHLEGFGGEEGVRKGKGELFVFLEKNNGTGFINSDLDYLVDMSKNIKNKIFYGNSQGQFITTSLSTDPCLNLSITNSQWGTYGIQTQLVGAYNTPNVEAAICIGKEFNVSIDNIKSAIEAFVPDNARSQLLIRGDNKIILDAYNANPSSMEVAIENFVAQDAEHKRLCLGAMMELGKYSLIEHQKLVDKLMEKGLADVILVGGDFKKIKHPFHFFEDVDKASEWLRKNEVHHSLILIKGSRSTQMEKLLSAF